MPVVVQRQVSTAQTVQKAMEVPPLQFTDKVNDIPVEAQRQISMVRTIQKTTEIPQLQCDDHVVDVPAEMAVQAQHVHVVAETAETPRLPLVSQIPQAQIVEKTVEEPQSQIVEKTAETPEIQMVRGTETSESAVVIETPLPTESARPMFVTTPVVETLQLAPAVEYVALAPAVTYGHAAADPVTTVASTIFPTTTVPVSMRRPYPVSQVMTQEVVVPFAVPKKLDSPQVQLIDKGVNVPVTAQRQVTSAQRAQKIVEVPQIQYIDKIVDAPVVARSEDVSVGTQTVSRKRKLSMETESADGTSDEEHGLVQEEECESKVDETREKHAAGEDLDLLPVAPNMEAGGSHLQATAEEERIVDWTQDLREIRSMVEFLVRRERKLDVKADVAVRRLVRLEKEHSQQEDEEREASLPVALADRTKVVKLVVDKWFVDKGFGFGRVPTGEVIFIHASVVRGAEVPTIGTDAWVQVVHDDARARLAPHAERRIRKEFCHHTMSARSRTTAGPRERGRPRAVPGVLCEKHLPQQTRAQSHSHPFLRSLPWSLFCVSHDISSVPCSNSWDVFRCGCHSFHRIFGSIFIHKRIPASLEPRSHGKRWSLFTRHTSLLVSSVDNQSQVNICATTAPRRRHSAEQPHGSFVSVKTQTSSRPSGHYVWMIC